jgi:inner membrane protein
MVLRVEGERTPGFKLMLAVLVGFVLTIPLFSVWLLVYDRQNQSEQATASITQGWGGAQTIDGPVLVIPYTATTTETSVESGQQITRTHQARRELRLAPETVVANTNVDPQVRKRSIYQAVVYNAHVGGDATFALPPDFARTGIDPSQMDLSKAELRFGLSDARGLGANPRIKADGVPLRLQPGAGSSGGRGFFAWIDASGIGAKPIAIHFDYDFRGNRSLSLLPNAGDTTWKVHSSWPSPSFVGAFLPDSPRVTREGFDATYGIGNLGLGRSIVSTGDPAAEQPAASDGVAQPQVAQINLIQPVDPYSQVDRATKYGFLFIGFTFLALLMFDVIGGVRVSPVEYLLMGAALVLFFVLLLAFAEVIGFTPAYVVASGAIAGLNTAYSAAVLASWRRAAFIGALLIGLYAVLYILLSLEAFSLLIGSLLLFAALAGVMYATRRIDWGGKRDEQEAFAEA